MEQISEDITLLYSYVKTMFFSTGESPELISEANEWLCNWSQNENILDEYEIIFNQFSENIFDVCYQNVLFITIKALQEFIRRRFGEISNTTIDKIINNVYILILKKRGIHVIQEYLLMILCDLLTLSQNINYVAEIINKIPNEIQLTFVALFFEVGQENYLKQYQINNTIQTFLTSDGISILENEKMSNEWLRIAKALLPNIDCDLFLSRFSLLIPKFFDALDNIENIKMVIDIMSNIFVYSIEQDDFWLDFLNFTIEFSSKIRQIVNGSENLINCLFSLWDGFFQFDCYNITYSHKFYKVFVGIKKEIFNVCGMFPVDFDMWKEMCENIIGFFQSFNSSHPIKSLLFDLFQLFDNILNFGVSQKLIKSSLKSLNKLSLEYLCRYLTEGQKSIGTVLIVGYNSKHLPRYLIEMYTEFLISSEIHPLFSLIFIKQTFGYLPEYLSKFIFFIQKSFINFPVQTSKTLYKIVKCKHSEIVKLIPNIFEISNYLHCSDFITLLYLIPTLLYLSLDTETENSTEIYQMIGSILIQHLNLKFSNSIDMFLDFIIYLTNILQKSPRKDEINPVSNIHSFYSLLFADISHVFQEIYLYHDKHFQKILCKYFIFILSEEQTNNYSYFIEWLENIVSNVNSLVHHHFVLLTKLPLDSCPKMLQFILSIDENASNDVISGISYFMKYILLHHFDLFWKYFSIQHVLFFAKNNYFSFSHLVNKDSDIKYLIAVLRILFSVTKTQQGTPHYQEITNAIQLIIERIPSDILISAFSDSLQSNNEIISKYIDLSSKDSAGRGSIIMRDDFNFIS